MTGFRPGYSCPLANWRDFRINFTGGHAVSIMATAWLIDVGLVTCSANVDGHPGLDRVCVSRDPALDPGC